MPSVCWDRVTCKDLTRVPVIFPGLQQGYRAAEHTQASVEGYPIVSADEEAKKETSFV